MRKIRFSGKILILGCGAVSRCLQTLLLRHIDMDFSYLTILDQDDYRDLISKSLASGAQFVCLKVTPENLSRILGAYLNGGDLLIDTDLHGIKLPPTQFWGD